MKHTHIDEGVRKIIELRQPDLDCHMAWSDLSKREQGENVDYLISYISRLDKINAEMLEALRVVIGLCGDLGSPLPHLDRFRASECSGAVPRRSGAKRN